MPLPRTVTLVPHDPNWAIFAAAESGRIKDAVRPTVEIHHIGSTAIAGVAAKPIIDLLAVAPSLANLERMNAPLERLGYVSRGERGIPGRHYWILTHEGRDERLFHLHGFVVGHPAIRHHLAFRDHLRDHPRLAAEYARIKERCAALHPTDSAGYSACKAEWVKRVTAEALATR